MIKTAIFTLYDTEGASSRYRIYQYLEDLKKETNVHVFPFWPNAYVSKYINHKKKYLFHIFIIYIVNVIKRLYQMCFLAPKFDTIILQKAFIPKLKFNFIINLLPKHKNIIFDVDDAVYLDIHDSSEMIASKVRTVLCGNHTLCNHYKIFNKNTIFLPTVENDALYEHYRHDTFNDKVIGWIGTKANLRNLEMVVTPINNIIKRYPNASFKLICSEDGGYCKKIQNSSFIKWDKSAYLKDLSNFTVGIMPLIDTPSNRGKCGFKLIQYLTMEKPAVGSPVGENSTILSFGGLIATNEEEWEEVLESLLFDRKIYEQCLKTINTYFYKQYSYKENYRKIKNAISVSM